jgi:penicillin-binding protein 1A
VLAIEDARFYQHGGVDYIGMFRAGLANLGRVKSQGASTITMQVARNVYLSSEKTFTRKIYEILLTFKLEHMLSKDQILEIYMNQIFLGRAYGFRPPPRPISASPEGHHGGRGRHAGRPAQGALGLQPDQQPQARPHPPALHHRPHGGKRLHHQGPGRRGPQEALHIRFGPDNSRVHAEYVAETVRQLVLNVYTTINAADQDVAYKACARASWTTSAARSTAAPNASSTCPPTPRSSTTPSTTRWPTTPTTAT